MGDKKRMNYIISIGGTLAEGGEELGVTVNGVTVTTEDGRGFDYHTGEPLEYDAKNERYIMSKESRDTLKENYEIYLVDFDGTITMEDTYPEIGEPNNEIIAKMRSIVKGGDMVIINTCRSQNHESDAKEWMFDNSVPYHYFNENDPERIKKYGGNDSRKLSGDYQIDDKNLFLDILNSPEDVEIVNKPDLQEPYYEITENNISDNTNNNHQKFDSGAVREQLPKSRPDLISPFFNMRVGEVMRIGAEKYADRNWEAGQPMSRIMASLQRHLNQYMMGETDEDHLVLMSCNAMMMVHQDEMIHRGLLDPELDDLPTPLRGIKHEE